MNSDDNRDNTSLSGSDCILKIVNVLSEPDSSSGRVTLGDTQGPICIVDYANYENTR